MFNLLRRKSITSAVVTLSLTVGFAVTASAEVTRLGGTDRYGTSDLIVKTGWPKGATTAVLASGLDVNEVDALTVAPFAKDKNAPIVLVNPKDSLKDIVAKFTALNAKTVYIASGTGVIPSQVDEALKKAGIKTVKRLGGVDRYETALNIAKELGASNSIVVASGNDAHLIDSLSIASIAAAKKMPIFLVDSSFDAATKAYIKSLGAKTTYVLGGTGAVSDDAVKSLPTVNRLAGVGRYETNAKVVDAFKTDAALNLKNIFIASGEDANLIDSLSGAPFAGSMGAPIVFLHDTINPAVNTLLNSIVNESTKITELGGTGAVTQAADETIKSIQRGVVIFPDKNLEGSIRAAINKTTGDIYKSDVEKITTLDASNKNIVSLSGMECVTNLTQLELKDNQISDISVISGLSRLTTLDLVDNKISDISALGKLRSLTNLSLSVNQISDISAISKLTNLQGLNLGSNQISDITAVSGLNNLKTLDLFKNNISDITAVSKLTNLQELELSSNLITDISAISGLNNLTSLDLFSNKISDITAVSKLTKLDELDLECNQISNISAISALTNLTYLNLASNQIKDISALSGLNKLTTLYLSNNKITDYSPTKSYYSNLKYKDFTLK